MNFLLIDKRDPQAHVQIVQELTEETIRSYESGLIDIYDPTNHQAFCGTWEQPDWAPLL